MLNNVNMHDKEREPKCKIIIIVKTTFKFWCCHHSTTVARDRPIYAMNVHGVAKYVIWSSAKKFGF